MRLHINCKFSQKLYAITYKIRLRLMSSLRSVRTGSHPASCSKTKKG